MSQFDKKNKKYVDRNNNLFEAVMVADELGNVGRRYSKDAWERPKTILDFSLFSATWTFSVPKRVWEQVDVDTTGGPGAAIQTPTSTFTNISSREGMLSVTSGTTLGLGHACRSKTHPRYQANRGQLFSTSITLPLATNAGQRKWGLSTDDDGLLFVFEGDGVDWDLFVQRKRAGASVSKTSIKSLLPEGFDPEKGHLYDIQFEWRGVGNIYYYIDTQLVYVEELLGTLEFLSVKDPALPVSFGAVCKEAGTEVELLSGCADVSSEGGTNDKTLFGSITTGNNLVTLGNAGVETAVLALKVPRFVNYEGVDVYNSRGIFADELVTWTRDEARTTVYIGRDIDVPNLDGLTWETIPDSLYYKLSGGITSPLNDAFLLDVANLHEVVSEWAEIDIKNRISNQSDNSDYKITPGDILIVTVAAITSNKNTSSTLYYSEEI